MFSLACAMKLCHLSRRSILASPGTNESLGKPNNVGVVLPEVGAGSGEVGKLKFFFSGIENVILQKK